MEPALGGEWHFQSWLRRDDYPALHGVAESHEGIAITLILRMNISLVLCTLIEDFFCGAYGNVEVVARD
jgi:hypothetical protein